ncbi:MAG TPA: glutathione S-transferase family protein [Frateuria sp.]|uniref:glutathione S-transferase family protein n=1 Tax=Frateuria sp. TaxID=2211372 RepID=UPI002D7E91E1|nr:glutathione S-transferase family protein [Frateuria sp.]HET6804078.1 glutathione S-transferase family protein [Frateuria sp.]
MYELYIANKNYSSWSLRPWLLMAALGIPFEEHLVALQDGSSWDAFRAFAPNGKVPCLREGDTVVWDSLAIVEYLAERHPGVWPADARARAWARCASAEMHAGFTALRGTCPMNCAVRVELHAIDAPLQRDLERLAELWNEGLARFGGPFLAGSAFGAVDAFFAPVAWRILSYRLPLDEVSLAYAQRLRELPGMQRWYAAALAETVRLQDSEATARRVGTVRQDLRAPA